MKKNLILYFFLAILFISCSKDDGPVPESVGLERVPAPLITKDASGTTNITVSNLGAFNGKFNVALYFPTDIPPSKMDIVIRKNGNSSNVKMLEAGITTFPKAYAITASQLSTLFGAPIVAGDTYDIGADIYAQSGKKYEAFPTLGLGYAAAFQVDHPGFSPSIRYTAQP